MGDAQAYDWPIEGQDSIFANGSLQPKAKTEENNRQDDSPENTLKLYRNGVAAYYGAQLETANEQTVYTELVAAQQQNRIKGAVSQSSAIEITLARQVVLPLVNSTGSSAYQNLCSEVGKAVDAFLFDYNVITGFMVIGGCRREPATKSVRSECGLPIITVIFVLN